MQKPLILLYTNVFDTTVGQNKAYMQFFSLFGDVLLVTSEMDLPRMIGLGDILAVPGGQDLYADRYGSKPGFFTKDINAHFEYLDEHLLLPWIETGKPIIGICRGMQALNVVCGGTLHRHINGHVQDDAKYWRHDTPQEMYTLLSDSGGYTFPIVEINSLHHQCVNEVAPGFSVIGWSEYEAFDRAKKTAAFKAPSFYIEKNGTLRKRKEAPMVPEVMVHDTRPYVAFQYHPEEFNCEFAISLIETTLSKYNARQEKAAAKEKITIS